MLLLRHHVLTLGFALVLAVAGCGGDGSGGGTSSGKNVEASNLKRLALSLSDLPSGYEVQEQVNSTTVSNCGSEGFPPAFVTKIKQLGFRGCAGATYRKEVTDPNRKFNRPGSLLIALKSADAASEALPEVGEAISDSIELTGTAKSSAPSARQEIAVSGLGDQSLPGLRLPLDLGLAGGKSELYVYVWRRGNVIAFAGSSDVLGDLSEQSTLDLAKKIDARIAAAG